MSIQGGKVLGSDHILGNDDGIILGSTTLGDADRNKIGLDEGTDLCYPDGSFDGSNEGKPVVFLFGELLGSDDRTVLGLSCGDLDAAKYSIFE